MRILFSPAHYYVSDKRGSEPSWPYYAMEALAKEGHEVWAVCGVADLKNKLNKDINLYPIFGTSRSENAFKEFGNKLRFYKRVQIMSTKILQEQAAKGHPIDIVHHFAPISPNSPNLLAIKKLSQPFTMGPAMKPPDDEADLATALGTKDDWKLKIVDSGLKIVSGFANRLYKKTLKRVDHLFAVTTEAQKYYQQELPKDKVTMVPAGIDVSKYLNTSSIKHNPEIILALCYLIKRKGIDVLLKAFAKISKYHPQSRIWIVGNGPEEDNLKQLAEELGIAKKVRFWGFIDNKQVSKYYAEAGIFVSPTRNEPFGQTFLEAMAAGLPVLATKTGGIPDIVTKDVGKIFDIDDVDTLAKYLDEILGNKSVQADMGKAAVARVKQVYDWRVIMKQYETVWKKLLNKK